MKSLAEKWEEFHKANPHVYDLFCQYTRELIAQGVRAYSAYAVAHRIRWNQDVETVRRDGDRFKLNNNHIAFYVRLWEREHPAYVGFFSTREQRAA